MTSLDHGSPTPRTRWIGIALALVLITVARILLGNSAAFRGDVVT